MAVTTLPSSLPSSRGVAAAAGASPAGSVSSRCRINPIRVESSATASKESKRPRSCNGDEPQAKRRRAGERDASSGTGLAAAAASSRAGCVRINPTRIEIESSTAKEPKRPRSCHGDEPPAKRRRAGETDASSGPTRMMSTTEKDGINRFSLISLLPSGCSPHEVNPLPDCVVSVLQENGTRRGGGAHADEEEIEVDVYTLRDEALKDGGGVYVEGRALLRYEREEEAPSQSKEQVTGLCESRSILARTTPKNTPSRAAPKRSTVPTSLFVPEAAPMSDPSKASSMRTPPRAVSKSITPRSVQTSIPSAAEFNSSPLAAKSNSIPLAAMTAVSNSIALPAKTAISQSLPRSTTLTAWSMPATASSWLPAPAPAPAVPKPLFDMESLSELLYAANKGCERFLARRQEIEKLRAAARQELELMVRTVEFNDPYIDYTDVFK